MANVTFTVPNKNGSYDGDAVVREYDSVTINAGDTVTVDQPCRGLIIYCKGDMVVNGTLTMSARGAAANPTSAGGSDNNAVSASGIQFGFFDGSSTDTLAISSATYNGMGTDARTVLGRAPSGSGTGFKVHTIARTANNGASRPSVSSNEVKESPYDIMGGHAVNGGACFGGGAAGGQAYEAYNGQGGAGGHSTCFSGGSGGGGAAGGGAANSGHRGQDADNYGGIGGNGGHHNESNGSRPGGSGGAGNPGNTDGWGSGTINNAGDGTGGFLVLIVGGNLTIGSSGVISAHGTQGGDNSATGDNSSMGGGSGGGHILIMCKGSVTANGSTIPAGHYQANAGSQVGSTGTWGEKTYNLSAWGGRGGKNPGTDCPVQPQYTGSTLTRQGGAGGKGLISIYELA